MRMGEAVKFHRMARHKIEQLIAVSKVMNSVMSIFHRILSRVTDHLWFCNDHKDICPMKMKITDTIYFSNFSQSTENDAFSVTFFFFHLS